MRIYTSGKMYGLSYDEQMEWRCELERVIKERLRHEEKHDDVSFVHPPLYYNYDKIAYDSQREIKDFDLGMSKGCNVVVVNLDEVHTSIGTLFEISAADTLKSCGQQMFIIGIGNLNSVHPWIQESLLKCCDSTENAANYIVDYLIV